MTGQYAAGTQVGAGRSQEEIERTVTRYGATEFAYGVTGTRAMVGFVAGGRQVRFILPMPDCNAREFTLTPTGKWKRSEEEARKAYEQATRQRWRALALVIKAKLEAVDAGIVTFEQEFAMHMVLPDGSTVADQVIPALASAYATGTVPELLPGGAS